jgi:hypothetical protein
VPDLAVTTPFEDVAEADQVGVDVGGRVLDRVADAGLGSQIHDGVEAVSGEQLGDGRPIDDVHLDEGEPLMRGQPREPGVLQADLIVVIHVVDAGHGIAALEQTVCERRADEPRDAGHQDVHQTISLRVPRRACEAYPSRLV